LRSTDTNIVQQEFTSQASIWADPVPTHLQEWASTLNLKASDSVLDVAAGSCRVSRAIAPWVKHVTAVELTEAMLKQGQEVAQKEKLTNITFKLGAAEHLLFADDSFDVTIWRTSSGRLDAFTYIERVCQRTNTYSSSARANRQYCNGFAGVSSRE